MIDPRTSIFNPQEMKNYQNLISILAKNQHKGDPLEGPLIVSFYFVRSKPKSSKKLVPWTKPDNTNYTKNVEDALNGIIWKDDAMIVDSHIYKRYGTTPMIKIEVSRWDPLKDEKLVIDRECPSGSLAD